MQVEEISSLILHLYYHYKKYMQQIHEILQNRTSDRIMFVTTDYLLGIFEASNNKMNSLRHIPCALMNSTTHKSLLIKE